MHYFKTIVSCICIMLISVIYSCKNSNTSSPDDTAAEDSIPVLSETIESSETVTNETPTTIKTNEANVADEANYVAASTGYKQAFNERYKFSFEIPEQWTAIDKSNNGDGYYLQTGEKGVDIRIYGEDISGNPIAYDTYVSICKDLTAFKFDDGNKGDKCSGNEDVTWYYKTKKTLVSLYVKAPSGWIEKNNTLLAYVAASISTSGTSGKKKL